MSDSTKPDLSRILGSLAAPAARVIANGDRKHGPGTWRELTPSDFIAAASRHLAAIKNGEYLDPDSGEPHWAHLLVNAVYGHEVTTEPGREVPIDAQLRLQDVKRWHIVRTNGPEQSVAEHTYNVAALGRRYLQLADRRELIGPFLERALVHDNDESLFGDVPSPAKPPQEAPVDFLGYVLKVCDLLEAYQHLSHYGVGSYAQRARDAIYRQMGELARNRFDGLGDPVLRQLVAELQRVTTAVDFDHVDA